MPIYEYECTGCGDRSETLQRMGDPAPDGCGKCGEPVKRLLSAPSFQFKGTGWYVTDYADKGKKSDSKETTGGKESGDGQSEVKTGGDSGRDESSSSGAKPSSSTDKSKSSSDTSSKTSDKPSSSNSSS